MNIKAVHLLSQPTDLREVRSVAVLSQLPNHGIRYTRIVNPQWTGEVPPHRVEPLRTFELTKAHYGCWKAHRDAITEHLKDVDALLVCECDCLPIGSMDDFVRRVNRAAEACVEANIDAFTLGYRHNGKTLEKVGDDVILINQWIGTHCYVVPIKSRQIFLDAFELPWEAFDFLTTVYLYDQQKRRIGCFADRPAATQADGRSLITGQTGSSEEHYRTVRHDI